MLVQNIKHEMKHNGLLRLMKKVPEDFKDLMLIGGLEMEKQKPLYEITKPWSEENLIDIPKPYVMIEINWKKKGKRNNIDVLIDICKDMSIKSFKQIVFGSSNNNQTRITWNDKENPFW